MNFSTHQAAGLLAAGLTLNISKTELGVVWLLGALAGSLGAALPDIDHRNSTPSRTVPMARHLGTVVKHRGPLTHSIWSFVILGVLVHHYQDTLLAFLPPVIIWCFFAGMYSHHFLDKFTPQGLRWLWPLDITLWPISSSCGISSNSWIEKTLVRPGLWTATAYCWLFSLFT